jgi:C-terminal processing protease CtpA/Prc
MKRFYFLFTPLLAILLLFSSCEDTSSGGGGNDPSPVDVELQNYMWRAMNAYYFWQEDVNVLSDTRFSNTNELNDFLAGYSNIPDFFYSTLVNQYGIVDRFSFLVDDYVTLENSFDGISLSNGVEFGLFVLSQTDDRVFGTVRYILPDTDASSKDIQRGDIFNRVNGTELTRSNYQSLLFGQDDYTLGFVNFENGDPENSDKEVALSKSQYTENPVYISDVIDSGDEKIGYVMYNAFVGNFDSQLNQAFAGLKSEGVTELVLDLRYNGGGSVRSSTYLGSMITGQFPGELFTQEKWNSKVMAYFNSLSEADRDASLNNYFPTNILSTGEVISSLGLSKVYVITSRSTASASELVINSLNPYINVVVVGGQGVGKFVASTTLYDSDDFTRNGSNLADHTYAIQPIILEELNVLGENNGVVGFEPNLEIIETNFDMGILGDPSEPLLNKALTDINSNFASEKSSKRTVQSISAFPYGSSKSSEKNYQKMYVDLKRFKQK